MAAYSPLSGVCTSKHIYENRTTITILSPVCVKSVYDKQHTGITIRNWYCKKMAAKLACRILRLATVFQYLGEIKIAYWFVHSNGVSTLYYFSYILTCSLGRCCFTGITKRRNTKLNVTELKSREYNFKNSLRILWIFVIWRNLFSIHSK